MDDMIAQFNMDKVSKSGAKFDTEKLQFFNSMHIRSRFAHSTPEEAKVATDKWRQMLLDQMPSQLHKAISDMSDAKITKVMNTMKIRLRYLSDIKNHGYLWSEPDYSTELGLKFQKKIKRSAKTNLQILKDIHARI